MNAIVPANEISLEKVELIKRTICQGASNEELDLFLHNCKRTGLDPLARQIYAVMRYDGAAKRKVMSMQVSIDGFRLIAQRTGDYAGQVGPFWCGEDGVWRDVWLKKTPPAASRVGVFRRGFTEPCWGVARFDAYAQHKSDNSLTVMWQKMPDVMIAKCAEALALRRAFPQELSGLYTGDEMAQADNPHDPVEHDPVEMERELLAPPPPISIPSEPGLIPVPKPVDGNMEATWRLWVGTFRKAIDAASNLTQVNAWCEANDAPIRNLKAFSNEGFAFLDGCINARRSILAQAPADDQATPFDQEK